MKYVVEYASLFAIAEAIRAKTGKTANLTLAQMPTEIEGIETGGGNAGVSKIALMLSLQPFVLTAEDLDGIAYISSILNYTMLSEITIPSSVKTIEPYTFSHCENLQKVTILEGLERIEGNMFSYSSLLKEIIFPKSLNYLGYSACAGCTALSKVTLNEGISKIEGSTFSNCSALTEIFIPKSVTRLDGLAFSNCTAMQLFDFTQHTEVPTLSSTNVFQNVPNTCQFKVPPALYEQWKAATNWSVYANQIIEG